MQPTTEFTLWLQQAQSGDAQARDRVFSAVYEELRSLARHMTPRGRANTLQPTAVVHEAYVKLAPNLDGLNDRVHFFAVASRAMRQVLADHARAARRDKRGGGWSTVTLDEQSSRHARLDADLFALNDCLERLATLNERHARVVELRVLGGLTIDETSQALGVSHTTVESDWSMARAWLWRQLAPTP